MINDTTEYYLAESYQGLETVGNIYEENGKEYIDVILKSGKIHAARVYRSGKPNAAHKIYNQRAELGFHPKGFIYIVRNDNEEKLHGICHWHPAFGPYLKCDDDIFDLPFGCSVHKLEWINVAEDNLMRLLPDEVIKEKILIENLKK